MADDDELCSGVCCIIFLWFFILYWDILVFFPGVGGWEWIILAVICTIVGWYEGTLLLDSIDESPSRPKSIMLVVLYNIILIITFYKSAFNSIFSLYDSPIWSIVALIVLPIIPFIIAGGVAVWIWDYFAARMTTTPYVSSADNELEFNTPIQTMETSQILMVDVTPVFNIGDVIEDAQCPYCSSNIRDTFHEYGGIVKCTACGTFHHKKCFDDYKICGSKKCKLRKT